MVLEMRHPRIQVQTWVQEGGRAWLGASGAVIGLPSLEQKLVLELPSRTPRP